MGTQREVYKDFLGERIELLTQQHAVAAVEWEEQAYTLVKVQLGHNLWSNFAVLKKDLSKVVYLLEMMSKGDVV